MFKEDTPYAFKQAFYTDWYETFALLPVKTEQDNWVWFKPVWKRQAYLPLQYRTFPIITQYSTIKRSRWDAY